MKLNPINSKVNPYFTQILVEPKVCNKLHPIKGPFQFSSKIPHHQSQYKHKQLEATEAI